MEHTVLNSVSKIDRKVVSQFEFDEIILMKNVKNAITEPKNKIMVLGM